MKTLKPLSLIGMVLLLFVGACENLPVPELETSNSPNLKSGDAECACCTTIKLMAGQYMDAGVLTVEPGDEGYLVITYTADGWCITETHLHVALTVDGIPQTRKGNPIPGQFDYKGEHDCATEVEYTVPLPEGYECGEIVIAAHAVVKMDGCDTMKETAWAALCGTKYEFPGARNWATYIKSTPIECCD